MQRASVLGITGGDTNLLIRGKMSSPQQPYMLACFTFGANDMQAIHRANGIVGGAGSAFFLLLLLMNLCGFSSRSYELGAVD